jgi:hypothetical protein
MDGKRCDKKKDKKRKREKSIIEILKPTEVLFDFSEMLRNKGL